jgi:hypothetical protein
MEKKFNNSGNSTVNIEGNVKKVEETLLEEDWLACSLSANAKKY